MSQPPLFVSAAKGFIAAFTGDILLKILGLAATAIVLRELSPYEYGQWQLLLSVVIGFGAITVPGISSMLVADISREIGTGNVRRANGIAVRASLLFIGLGAIGALALVIAASHIRTVSGIDMVYLMRVLAISVFALGIKQSYQMVMQSRLKYVQAQVMKTVDRSAYLAGIAVFVLVLGWGFHGIVYAYVLSTCTSVVVFAPYMLRLFIREAREQELGEWRPFIDAVWGRGKWALGSDGINAAIGAAWPWIVGYFLSIELVGIISVTLLILGQIAAFVPINYVLRSILPRTAESPERMRDWLFRSMKISFWGHIMAGIAAFFACSILFPLFFPKYVPSLTLLAALLISLPLRGLAVAASEWFFASAMQRELFFVSGIPKAVTYLLLPLFLWFGGIIGYVLWYLISSDVVLQARIYIITKRLGSAPSLSFLLKPDASDIDIMDRVIKLLWGRVRRFFVSVA